MCGGMDLFLASAAQASSVLELPFSEMEGSWSHSVDIEEAKEQLYRLIDAYGVVEQVAHRDAYQEAIMRGITSFLAYILRQVQMERKTRRPVKWQLNLADILLLTMFFSDLITVNEPALYHSLTQALGLLYQLAVPLVFLRNSNAASEEEDDEEKELRESTRSELNALRVMLSKRLVVSTTPGGAGGTPYPSKMMLYQWTLDALMQFFHTVWGSFQWLQQHKDGISKQTYETDADAIIRELTELCDGMLLPVRTSLESQIQCMSTAHSSGRMPQLQDPAVGGGRATARAAMLVASALHLVEHILWRCGGNNPTGDPVESLSPTTPPSSASVFQHVANELIGLLHKYLTLRQRLPAEGASGESGHPLDERGGGGGRYFSRQSDVFRSASVQQAMRRVLSVVVEPDSHGRSILQPRERAALTAALNSFGGAVKRRTAPHDGSAPTANEAEDDEGRRGETPAAEAWAQTPPGGGDSRLRRCAAVLAVKHVGIAGGDPAEEGDGEGLDALAAEEGLEMGLGARRPLVLQSSLGPVTASALVDMVMMSLSALDLFTEEAIQALHLQGLQAMQYEAAKRAQAEELERLRRLEQQGVDAIPWGKLLEHVQDSAALHAKGLRTLRHIPARARLQREAFRSILHAYHFVRRESEATVRGAQALIARTLVQIPPALADAALDELLHHLLHEFRRERAVKQEVGARSLVGDPGAAYQLTLQALFMFFSAQAPVRARSAADVATAALLLDDDGLSRRAVAAAILHAPNAPGVDTENPIAFLHGGAKSEGETGGAWEGRGRKRARGGVEEGPTIDDSAPISAFTKEEDEGFSFANDTRSAPCAYSHALCRVMELAESCQLNALLLDILLQAPSITRYVWNYLYRQYCLSTDKVRCIIGFWLLKNLAIRREVYRSCALNLLLHLCSSTREYARRLAIREIGSLLTTTQGPHAKPVMSQEVEGLLVRHAKRQMASIPGYQYPISGRVEEGKSAEEVRAQETLGRHLGLFLKLCLRQPRQLFPSLLEMYKQCVERNHKVMMREIPRHSDIHRMMQVLFKSDPASFMITVVPYLRRYSKDATCLVQSILWSIGENLREMCAEAEAVAEGTSNSMEALENYKKVAIALLAHVKAMYMASIIPVSSNDPAEGVKEVESEGSLHDIRFVAPFLSLTSAAELKQTYLRAFLYFVQVQLQLQRRCELHGGREGLSARESTFLLTRPELRELLQAVIREVLVKHPLRFDDGVARGMSLVDFFVYLHRAPQESVGKRGTPFEGGGAFATGAGGGGTQGRLYPRNQEKGILDTSTSQQDPAFDDDNDAGRAMPPIGVITTREVITVCLELTRSFDQTTTLPLYGPEDVLKAMRRMLHTPPVPPQLMSTVLIAAAAFTRSRGSDFVRAVVQHVLIPLERASAWQSDPQLWRGVLLFAETYYRECGGFLINLPDQVLIQALRDHPVLMAHVREEHGNNASFGHILANA